MFEELQGRNLLIRENPWKISNQGERVSLRSIMVSNDSERCINKEI